MAINAVFQAGRNLSLEVPAGTKAGDPLRIGSLNCIAVTDRGDASVTKNLGGGVSITQPTGGVGNGPTFASVRVGEGAWRVPVVSAAAVEIGQPVYIKADNTLTDDATGNTLWGISLQARTALDGDLRVLLVDSF